MSDKMSEYVSASRGNNIAVISLTRPDHGTLDAHMRQTLLGRLREANDDGEIHAIVLTSEPNGLNLDLPFEERISQAQAPSLEDLTEALGALSKPIVAALRGRIADAGLELALSADARLVLTGARFGLPTLTYASLPTAQALYRLTSLLGPQKTIAMLSSVSDLPASQPELSLLFHETVSGNAVGRAAELARHLANESLAPKTPAFEAPLAYQEEITTARAQSHELAQTPEYAAALECLEAALLLPSATALPFISERRQNLSALPGTQGKAYMRYAKLALMGRPAGQMPRDLTIVGTGLHARKLALTALRAGLAVRLLQHNSPAPSEAIDDISRSLQERVTKGLLPSHVAQSQIQNLSAVGSMADLNDADLVVEAAAKSVNEIGDLCRDIRAAMGPRGVLLVISGMRNGAARFSHLLGARTAGAVFHPDMGHGAWAEIMLRPSELGDAHVRSSFTAAMLRLGLPAILQRAEDGSAAARLSAALMVAAEDCIARGADPLEVDNALPMQFRPFASQNAEGFRAQAFRLASLFGEKNEALCMNTALVQAGVAGAPESSAIEAKTGALTDEARRAIEVWRAQLDIATEAPDGAFVQTLANAALFSTAAHLVHSGAVSTAWEADFAAAAALGLRRGALPPLLAANTSSLLATKRQLEALTPLRPSFFAPPPDLDDRIKNGQRYEAPQAAS